MREQLLGTSTGGIWTTSGARKVGLTSDEIRGRRESGEWSVVRRGTYCDGGVVPSPAMRAWAAVLSCGGPARARACGRTAARLVDVPLIDDDDPLLEAARRHAAHDDLAVQSSRRGNSTLHPARLALAAGDLAEVAGCPTLTPARLLLDLTRLLSLEAVVCAVDDALHRELVTPSELEEMVDRWSGRVAGRRLRTALGLADGRAESPLETLGRLVLLPVAPGLVPQVRLRDRSGRIVARVDLGDEALRLGVEGDGKRGHAGADMVAKDRRREREAARLGWHLERYTWWDVRRGPRQLQARVLEQATRLGARAACPDRSPPA